MKPNHIKKGGERGIEREKQFFLIGIGCLREALKRASPLDSQGKGKVRRRRNA
jgi:hypothetical protein